jgi:hypothetical protein
LFATIALVSFLAVPNVQAQVAPSAPDAPQSFYLPIIWKGDPAIPTPTPTPQWATQTKTKSGIHLGNRSTDWQDESHRYTFLERIGYIRDGVWPAAVVVQSDQLYEFQRLDPLCRVSSASVKTINGKEYELYAYLTQGVTHHNLKVVIRITPSPGNFRDEVGTTVITHTLLAGETPAGGDYCPPDQPGEPSQQDKVKSYRDIRDLAQEMNAMYAVNTGNGWDPESFYFEPANEPNNEWYLYRKPVTKTLNPYMDNKRAWIDMDEYFAALYDKAIAINSNLQVLSPSMGQANFGEHYALGTCTPYTVVDGNGRSRLDFMKKVYGYDIAIDAHTTPKADGFAWHNYWRKGREIWLPPYRGGQYPPTIDEYCEVSDQYKPHTDHLFQYLSDGMQESISVLPSFITEADLMSPCQLGEAGAAATDTSNSLRTFIEQEAQANEDTGYVPSL